MDSRIRDKQRDAKFFVLSAFTFFSASPEGSHPFVSAHLNAALAADKRPLAALEQGDGVTRDVSESTGTDRHEDPSVYRSLIVLLVLMAAEGYPAMATPRTVRLQHRRNRHALGLVRTFVDRKGTDIPQILIQRTPPDVPFRTEELHGTEADAFRRLRCEYLAHGGSAS